MATLSASTPEGRIQIDYPDAFGLEDLYKHVGIMVGVMQEVKDKPHQPPETGRTKSTI